MKLTFDPVKNRQNLQKHDIDLAEVEGVFHDPLALTREDRDHPEERFVTLGRDGFDRLLVVAYTYRGEDEIRLISARFAEPRERRIYEGRIMKDYYDFSNAKRGEVIESAGKTRITIWLDDSVLSAFRHRAAKDGRGYQTLINEALKAAAADDGAAPLTLKAIRRVVREELRAA